jgi:hypothetical protein
MEAVTKQAAAIGTLLSFVFAFVGAPLIWSLLTKTADDETDYEGYFSAAGYQLFLVWLVPLLYFISSLGANGNINENFKRLNVAAMGIVVFMVSESITLPGSVYSFAKFTLSAVNAVRIAEEEDSQSLQTNGFVRTATFHLYGLGDYKFPLEHNKSDSEDMQHNLGGDILLTLAVALGFATHLGLPVLSKLNTKDTLVGFTPAFLTTVTVFILWTHPVASDPTHVFYETTMGTIAVAMMIGLFSSFGALFPDSNRSINEIGLFVTGAFGLTAPVRVWTMIAFANELDLYPQVADETNAQHTVEMDAFRTAFVLLSVASLIHVYAAVKAMGASATAAKVPVVNTILVVLGAILVLLSASFYWHIIHDALDSVDKVDPEDDNQRYHAANFYIFITTAAAMCFAVIQYRPSLGALWWSSIGIIVSVWCGFTNVGTHDRQLWMVDLSFSGMNELRVYWDEDYVAKRAFGVDDELYDLALAASIMYYLGGSLLMLSSYALPWCGNGRSPNAAFTTKFLIVSVVSMFCAFVGMITLWSTENLVSPPIQSLQSIPTSTDGSGELDTPTSTTNMVHMDDGTGERFSLNLYSSVNSFGGSDISVDPAYFYGAIFLYTALSWIGAWANLYAIVFNDQRSATVLTFVGGTLLTSLTWCLLYGASDKDGKQYCKDMAGGDAYPNEKDCRQFTNGFVFLFFQGVLSIVAGCLAGTSPQPKADEPEGDDLTAVEKVPEPEPTVPATPDRVTSAV